MTWVCIPSTVLQAREVGFLETSCLDTLQSELLKSKSIPERFYFSGSLTEFCRYFRFGMTLRPSDMTTPQPETISKVSRRYPWNSPFAAGSRNYAKTLHRAEPALDLKANGLDCGWKWPESSVKYDPSTRSWRIRQTSLFGGLEPYSETWPRWGTMRDGECWEQSTLAHRTKEIESGLWLTPRVTEIIETPENFRARMNGKRKNDRKNGFSSLSMQIGGRWNPTWAEWLMGWPMTWTEPAPLGTDKFQQWLHSHGRY